MTPAETVKILIAKMGIYRAYIEALSMQREGDANAREVLRILRGYLA
jgi:hypothetical protein